MNNWLAAETYAYTGTLSASQWAWEFLRRNPEYCDDYAWFIRNWNILEQAYGKPPHRDFPAWKADPRASRINALGESLLIECWMGEKWGFYKFPLDPARPAPIPATELLWREPSQEAVLLSDRIIMMTNGSLNLFLHLLLQIPQQYQRTTTTLQ